MENSNGLLFFETVVLSPSAKQSLPSTHATEPRITNCHVAAAPVVFGVFVAFYPPHIYHVYISCATGPGEEGRICKLHVKKLAGAAFSRLQC